MSPTLPFLSEQPNIGDPSLRWADFEHAKLRRFPSEYDFQLQNHYLGGGIDGFVFKAKINGQPTAAVKIFPHNRQPLPVDGVGIYWAFERECVNCALLQMIDASLRRAADTEQAIHLVPKPTTKAEALRNLRASPMRALFRAIHNLCVLNPSRQPSISTAV
ncbi:hypothetical protein BR93DRAFT_445142 [Coniochaeta sp. PMI_546]|nr:hypothetical protein BR93DRAFT_445142 [Coniochaeta sp. PMI_546]